jgi:hypothetical protein
MYHRKNATLKKRSICPPRSNGAPIPDGQQPTDAEGTPLALGKFNPNLAEDSYRERRAALRGPERSER